MTSVTFMRGIDRNLQFWHQQVEGLNDVRIQQLHPQHLNLRRAVELGSRFTETCVLSAELFLKAFIWIERTRSERHWLQLAQRLEKKREVRKQEAIHTRLLIRIGNLLRLTGQMAMAIEVHNQAQAVADAQQQPEIHFQLSENYRHLHQIEAGMEHAETALDLLEGRENALAGAIRNTFGLLHLDRGAYEQAERLLRQALAIEKTTGQITSLSRVYNNLGLALQKQGRHQSAREAYDKAITVLEGGQSHSDRIVALLNKGSMHFYLNELEQAQACFEQADAQLHSQKGLHALEAMTLTNLGKVAQAQEKYGESCQLFVRSARLFEMLGNEISWANALGAQAEIAVAQNNVEIALCHYEDAVRMLQKHPDHAFAQEILEEFSAEYRRLRRSFPKVKH